MKVTLILLATLVLTGCGDSAFKHRVQEAVKFELTDPQSAQFTDDWYDESRDIACGAVNARNQFGGYVGKRLWVWREHGAHHQPVFGTAEFQQFNRYWDECQAARFPDQVGSPAANAAPQNKQ